jgi:thioredoxin 1
MTQLLMLQIRCPCSGGKALNPLLLLAIVAGIWLLVGWIKRVFKRKGDSLMNKIGKIVIVFVLIAAVAIVIVVKQYNSSSQARAPQAVGVSIGGSVDPQVSAEYRPEQITGKGLPSLIDIGADTCIPCKLMAPILEELKKELAGKLEVQFLDLNKYPGVAKIYGIKVMPTQIFYDATGKELFRHEGFYSKEDILIKWKYLGIELAKTE